jgi:hypothetical protein
MTGPNSPRARIFWFELANKWAIRAPRLADAHREHLFAAALRTACNAAFHHGAQAWMVADTAIDAAKAIMARYHPRYEFIARPRYEPPPPRVPVSENRAYETFCALVGWSHPERLSLKNARALYRRAARRLHPDAGGSSEKMAALNAAWWEIKTGLG